LKKRRNKKEEKNHTNSIETKGWQGNYVNPQMRRNTDKMGRTTVENDSHLE
jgi:hypothetical protein